MLIWFHQWKLEQGLWPVLPQCDFQFGQLATVIIQGRVTSVLKNADMIMGEMQTLCVFTTLKYLAEIGPKSPPAGQVAQSVQSLMRPLQQADISFGSHAVLGYATST